MSRFNINYACKVRGSIYYLLLISPAERKILVFIVEDTSLKADLKTRRFILCLVICNFGKKSNHSMKDLLLKNTCLFMQIKYLLQFYDI